MTVTSNILQARIRLLEQQLRQSQNERDEPRAVLYQHVELTRRDGDDHAAESKGEFHAAKPCNCPACRTYRAALWYLEKNDAQKQ